MTYQHSKTARSVLKSLVPVICPADGVPLADAIVDHMELTLGAAPAMLQRGLGAGLLAYDVGALPRFRKRAQKLTGDAAERYFRSWEDGPTPIHVQLAHGINQLMSLACYEQPSMMAALGYQPAPWMRQVTERRLTVYRDDVQKQQAQILAPDPLRPGVRIRPAGRRERA